MSRFSSIDPVGILNAWTTNVRMNSARMTAMTIDSKYSRTVDFLNSAITPLSCRPSARQETLPAVLAFFLLLEQLPFARDVAAVALRQHVLPQRLHRLARDDPAPDRRLN